MPLKKFDILVLSLGALSCPSLMGENDPIYQVLRDRLGGKEVVVAAGNHGDDRPSYPAAYGVASSYIPLTNVTSVGSTNSAKTAPSAFSGKGSFVQVNKPAENVIVHYPNSDNVGDPQWRRWSGTSFAAPQHAADLAL